MMTRTDSFLLPCIDDTLDYITGPMWFSTLDLQTGYWQIELVPEACPKTAFSINHGLWDFWSIPFSLFIAPAIFNELMMRVLSHIPQTKCVVYLNNLLVYSADFSEGIRNLKTVPSIICRTVMLHCKQLLAHLEQPSPGPVVSTLGA